MSSSSSSPDVADLFSQAMDKAIDEGKGWNSEAERQAYIDKVTADDYLPAIFCTTPEELANAPDAASFQALLYDNQTAASNIVECKEAGNEKLRLGRQNEARNFQYFRDAVDKYTEAIGWGGQIVCTDDEGFEEEVDGVGEAAKHDKHRNFTRKELADYTCVLYANRAATHMEIKNWGFAVRDCVKSIEQDKSYIKSYHRLGKSHQQKREFEMALKACEDGLGIEKDNKALLSLEKVS